MTATGDLPRSQEVSSTSRRKKRDTKPTGNDAGSGQCRLHDLLMAGEGPGHETHLYCLFCTEWPSGVRQLASQALVADDLGQAAERAYVGCDTDVHLLKMRVNQPLLPAML